MPSPKTPHINYGRLREGDDKVVMSFLSKCKLYTLWWVYALILKNTSMARLKKIEN